MGIIMASLYPDENSPVGRKNWCGETGAMQDQREEVEYSTRLEELSLERSMDSSCVVIGSSGSSVGRLVEVRMGQCFLFLQKARSFAESESGEEERRLEEWRIVNI